MQFAEQLHAAVSAVCPILGVAVGRRTDKSTWRIDFDPSATATQRTAAQNVMASFVFDAYTAEPDPLIKLQAFIKQNPDVAKLLNL